MGQMLWADYRRIRVYPLKMRFVQEPDPQNELEGKIDRMLEQNITAFGDAFLGELFTLYPRYLRLERDGGAPLPLAMVQATTESFNTMDPVRNFVVSTYERTQDADSYVATEEVTSEARAYETKNDAVLPIGRNMLLHALDEVFVGRKLTSDGRKFTVGGTRVSGWKMWRKIEE